MPLVARERMNDQANSWKYVRAESRKGRRMGKGKERKRLRQLSDTAWCVHICVYRCIVPCGYMCVYMTSLVPTEILGCRLVGERGKINNVNSGHRGDSKRSGRWRLPMQIPTTEAAILSLTFFYLSFSVYSRRVTRTTPHSADISSVEELTVLTTAVNSLKYFVSDSEEKFIV